ASGLACDSERQPESLVLAIVGVPAADARWRAASSQRLRGTTLFRYSESRPAAWRIDRKSTRLNSSHLVISYAVFCLKKKNTHGIKSQPVVQPAAMPVRLTDLPTMTLPVQHSAASSGRGITPESAPRSHWARPVTSSS